MNEQAAAPHADPERAFDGQYQLGSEIGAGALGVVYRGVDEKLDKQVAIKVWHARFEDAAPQREQYDTEARALTALEHPNLVAISDYGIAGKAPYLVMELLEGERLDARMRGGALRSAQAQDFMQSVLRALGYMHMRGVVHRNLKPDNVFLAKAEAGETLKLLDLGLESLAANANAAGGGTAAAQPASVYDAPEREQGVDPDGRADVYAAGVLMLQMLIGHEPGRELLRAAAEPAGAEALASILPSAQPEVKNFIAKAIASERSARFGNADQMLRALVELPTPWLIGQEEEPAAAAPSLAAAAWPGSQSAHAQLGSSDTLAMPAADGGEAAAGEDADADFRLQPIGLVARLRTHKKLLMIGGGVLGLAFAGAALAAALSGPSKADKAAEQAAAKKAAKHKQHAAAAGAPAPALERPYHPDEAEQIDETGEGALAQAARAASAAGSGAANGKAGTPQGPANGPSQADGHAPPAAMRAEVAAATHGDPAAPGGEAKGAATVPGESAANGGSLRGEANGSGAAHGGEATGAAEVPRGSAAPANAAPGEANGESAAHGGGVRGEGSGRDAARVDAAHAEGERKAAGEPDSAAASGADSAKALDEGASGPAHAAVGVQPTAAENSIPAKQPLTPQQLGGERHVEPDQAEIRQMLALALESSPRAAPADPWDIAIPSSLQALRDAIARGERGTAGNIKTLRRYNAANPEDVYGHLLLAGFYGNRGFALDALDQYDMAYRIDGSSRGAPEMLKHALDMVAQGIAASEAERFIDRVYGREAQAQLSQQLRAKTTNAAAATRLKQLQSRLALKRR